MVKFKEEYKYHQGLDAAGATQSRRRYGKKVARAPKARQEGSQG